MKQIVKYISIFLLVAIFQFCIVGTASAHERMPLLNTVTLSESSDIPNTWGPDRLVPTSFANIGSFQGRSNVLQIGLNGAQGAYQWSTMDGNPGSGSGGPGDPTVTGSGFFALQGRTYINIQPGAWTLSADLWIESSWSNPANGLRRAELWGLSTNDLNNTGLLPAIGFTNEGNNVETGVGRFRWATGSWAEAFYNVPAATAPVNYGTWNSFKIEFVPAPTNLFKYYVNGVLVASTSSSVPVETCCGGDHGSVSNGFHSVRLMTYNYTANNGGYNVHWSNVCTSANVLNLNTGLSYCTIQEAINAAQTLSGHIIEVASGTYTENVTINKAVTVRGPNHTVAYNGSRAAEAVIDGNVSITVSGASLSGFEIYRPILPTNNQLMSVTSGGTTVSNNIIKIGEVHYPSVRSWVLLNTSSGTVTFSGNELRSATPGQIPRDQDGNDISTGMSGLRTEGSGTYNITGNRLAVSSGGTLNGGEAASFKGGTVDFNGNVVNGDIMGGITAFGSIGNTTIRNNTISGYWLLTRKQPGISVNGCCGFEASTGFVTIKNNIVGTSVSGAKGIDIVGIPGANIIELSNNDLSGNSVAISHTNGSGTVNATCNWYGQASGPSAGQVVGSVTNWPFLITGTNLTTSGPGFTAASGACTQSAPMYLGGSSAGSTFGSYSMLGPLPLALLDFTGEALSGSVKLRWKTAWEQHTSHFEVERSIDGAKFTRIGTVKAAGNSDKLRSYEYMDEAAPQGIVYYRLRLVDMDGKYSYTNIVRVKIDGRSSVTIRPNPTAGQATMVLPSGWTGSYECRIISASGAVVFRQTGLRAGSHILDFSRLSNGLYRVTLWENGESVDQQWIMRR